MRECVDKTTGINNIIKSSCKPKMEQICNKRILKSAEKINLMFNVFFNTCAITIVWTRALSKIEEKRFLFIFFKCVNLI